MVMMNEWNRWDGSKIEQGLSVKEMVKNNALWSDAKYNVSFIILDFQVSNMGMRMQLFLERHTSALMLCLAK